LPQERSLCLRWSAVDLVCEEEVREDRAGPELEVTRPLVVDRRARDVRRHQVRRELDAGEAKARHLCEGARDERLGEARKVLDQDVAVREYAKQDELECLALPDDGALDFVEEAL